MKSCNCGTNNYEWVLDSKLRSFLLCKDCNTNFFDEGIGVILINWEKTDISKICTTDVLTDNINNNGVLRSNI